MSLNRSGIWIGACPGRERTTPLMELWLLLKVKFHAHTKQLQHNTITVSYITMFMTSVSRWEIEDSEEDAPHIKFHYLQENQIFFYHWYLNWFMYIIYRLPLSEKSVTKAIYTNLVLILSHKVTSLTHNYLLLKFHANFLKTQIRYTQPIKITTTGKAVDWPDSV